MTTVGNEHVHGIDAAALAGAPPFTTVADDVLASFTGRCSSRTPRPGTWASSTWSSSARAGSARSRTTSTRHPCAPRVRLSSYSLDSLCKELDIGRGRAHRAGADVLALRAVFERTVKALAPASARDLGGEDRRAPGAAAIVEACAAALEKGAPVSLTYRPSKKQPVAMTMASPNCRPISTPRG
ncbi:MAG: hypothetical protein U0235_08010 [Polyangiaceae bacterium]